MYEGFEYVSDHGIVKRQNYRSFAHNRHSCELNDRDLQRRYHIRDIGYVEHDGKTNEELKAIVKN